MIRTVNVAREQTVPQDSSAQKNTAHEEREEIDGVPLDDVDGVPLEDIALPEDKPETAISVKVNNDSNVDANTNNNIDFDSESAAEHVSDPTVIPPERISPVDSSEEIKSKDLSDGELVDDENDEGDKEEVNQVKQSDDETSKKSPKPDSVSLRSVEKLKTDADKVQELLDVLIGTDEPERPFENGKSSSAVSKGSSDERDDLLELEERDGLVDITDEEISNYEKSWEMEENGKKAGLEGLETEAISDNEYPPEESDAAEDQRLSAPELPESNQDAPDESGPVENGRSGEEGEIITEDRHPVQWKKLSKTTKERSYRGDREMSKKEANKEITKKKEKRKELERYDVRKLISEKPRRKVDEFGRDISSHSRSNTRSPSRGRRSLSRGKKRRSRSRSRSKERVRSKERNKERSRSKSRSKEKRRERSKEKSKERSRVRSTSRSKKKRRSRSPKKDRARSREKASKERKKRKKSPSMSCSSCSCSSCEREKRRSKKLTVIVTNEEVGKRKEKKKKDKKSSPKNRRRSSPVPSKEVFTSGDNILVSVNFKSSKSGESRKESSKRRKDDETRKKKDKGTKENQPVRSIVTAKKSKKKLNTKNTNQKPVAIIDLDASPFREVNSPKEVIVLTDSDSEDKRPQQENAVPVSITGPKTPPEPLIKFNIVNNKQQSLRTMANPLMDALLEQLEDEGDDVEGDEIPHKGPNTPPEPPVPYDPFEPTKSRSPTPVEAQMDRSSPPETQQAEQVSLHPYQSLKPYNPSVYLNFYVE